MRCVTLCCWVPFVKRIRRFKWKKFYEVFIKSGTDNPVREIWRLRLNFFMVMVLSFLGGIGYTSTLASLHQYITNPSDDQLNGTDLLEVVRPGLGKSEFFYSWMITVYSIGEVMFAPLTGYAARWVPYWYILLVGIALHTFGYTVYALATTGGLMIVARFLTGAYSGIIETVGYAYISEKEVDYLTAYARAQSVHLGKKKIKPPRVKEKAYAFLTFTITVSYLAGPGMSALVAQFPEVDQFRWVGWFNVVLGVLSVFLLFTLFHGEYKSVCCSKHQKSEDCKTAKKWWQQLQLSSAGCIKISVLIFFLFASYVMDSSYGVVDTLFNPILSDIFGFTEKEISYFFVGVMIVYVIGSLVLVLLNTLSLSSQIVAVFAVITSMVGAGLIADWQSVGYDPCTEFSVFHYPSLENNISTLISDPENNFTYTHRYLSNHIPRCKRFNFDSDRIESIASFISVAAVNESSVGGTVPQLSAQQLQCSRVDIDSTLCLPCTTIREGCMSYKVNLKSTCVEVLAETRMTINSVDANATVLSCKYPEHPFSVCVNVHNAHLFSETEVQDFKEAVSILTSAAVSNHIPNIESLIANLQESIPSSDVEEDLLTARDVCVESDKGCYWNQFSQVTKEDCFSCPPICRSIRKSLNFVQFSLGAAVFVIAIPISRVVLMVLVSDNLSQQQQAPFTGIVIAAGGIARTISPLWIDAAYEVVQKRTFFAMTIKLFTFIPVLIGLLLLYKFLQKEEPEGSPIPSSSEAEDSELEEGNLELKKLVSDVNES